MTDTDLMQQALDAMERYQVKRQDFDRFADEITALRERLAQPNDFNPDWDAMAVMVEEQQRMAKRIEELEAQRKPLLSVLSDVAYGLESARIWGGMDWTYNPLHPFKYLPLRDKARAAIAKATGERT